MIRFKVEKKLVKLQKEVIHAKRTEIEFPIETMKKCQSFIVPVHLTNIVRNRIQLVLREKPNRKYVTRTTADQQKLRVWRIA